MVRLIYISSSVHCLLRLIILHHRKNIKKHYLGWNWEHKETEHVSGNNKEAHVVFVTAGGGGGGRH